MYKFSKLVLPLALSLLVCACEPVTITVSDEPPTSGPSVEEAVIFVAEAEQHLAVLGQNSERMSWVLNNFITEDTRC